MLNFYDWLRRSEDGSELLATLDYIINEPERFPTEEKLGPPLSAFHRPCRRCWVYPCAASELMLPDLAGKRKIYVPSIAETQDHCIFCRDIIAKAETLRALCRQVIVLWGFVSHIPNRGLFASEPCTPPKGGNRVISSYIHDEHHFLLILSRGELKSWIQELLMYHGQDLKGLIQLFPLVRDARNHQGEVLCRAGHQESRFPMDKLRVRFFSNPSQLYAPRSRDEEGLLTFEITEFLRLLDMAEIFRTLLRPSEQKALHELIHLNNRREEQFYWGRFTGYLSRQAKDMLNAWKIRQWPKNQVKLLYELVDYVFCPF